MGVRPGRLPRRQRRAAPRQHPAAVAPRGTAGRARGMAPRRGVRRPSPARRIRRLDHRAQGPALGAVLPRRVPGLDAVHGGAAGHGRKRRRRLPGNAPPAGEGPSSRKARPFTEALFPGAGAVRARDARQVHRGHPARGAPDRAVVETGPRDRRGPAPARALLRGGTGHHARGPVVLQRQGAPFPRVLDDRADAHRGARPVVLRRQAVVADRSHRHLPALGGERRGPDRLGVRHRRRGGGRGALAAPAPDRPRAAGRGRCSSR